MGENNTHSPNAPGQPNQERTPQVDVAGAAQTDSDPPRKRAWSKAFLSLCLTLVVPGLGHLVAGCWRRGCVWLAVWVGANALGLVLLANARLVLLALVLCLACVGMFILVCVDAFLQGLRSTRPMFARAWMRCAIGGMVILINFHYGPLMVVLLPVANYMHEHHVEAFVLSGMSMSPTMLPGDRFLAHKRTDRPRWSLVVITHPDYQSAAPAVRRIVGLPGETIELIDGEVYVNGRVTKRPESVGRYAQKERQGRLNYRLRGTLGAGCTGNPIKLEVGEYYLLGDNTHHAYDSRLWELRVDGHQLGALPCEYVRSRVTTIYWPPSRWRIFRCAPAW